MIHTIFFSFSLDFPLATGYTISQHCDSICSLTLLEPHLTRCIDIVDSPVLIFMVAVAFSQRKSSRKKRPIVNAIDVICRAKENIPMGKYFRFHRQRERETDRPIRGSQKEKGLKKGEGGRRGGGGRRRWREADAKY